MAASLTKSGPSKSGNPCARLTALCVLASSATVYGPTASGMVDESAPANPANHYAISKYARDKRADLLVVNSPSTHLNLLDRIFTHDIEYVLADLPCDLLIVHSRV